MLSSEIRRSKGPGSIPGLLRLSLAVLLIALAGFGSLAPAQAQDKVHPGLPVLTLDFERLFSETRWGKRISDELQRDSMALNAENNRIAEDLIAEEKSLTDRRAALPPATFLTEANAFDERATGIRNAQRAKSQALTQHFETDRQTFFSTVAPLMDEILTGRGAVVVLDRRVIIRGLEAADITGDLVALVDARFGDGSAVDAMPAEPPADGQ